MGDDGYYHHVDLTAVALGETTEQEQTVINSSFVQAQQDALQRHQQQREQQPPEEALCDDESAALAAALAASQEEQDLRVMQQREEEVERRRQENERKRRRERELQLQEQEEVARTLQREEEDKADQELAQAMECSASEAQVQATTRTMNEDMSQVQHKRQKERHAGCWDCVQCTYENAPYAPQCKMCQSRPPPEMLAFQPIPEATRFGLELELIIPDGEKDGYSLEWLASELTKLGPPKVEYHGYTHQTLDDAWKLVTDSSLRGRQHHQDLCFEIVSPILQGSPGLGQLRIILENVRRLGIATNRTCGFHVHIDATSLPLFSLRRNSQCFVALENAFDLLVAGNHRSTDQNQYCRSNRIAFGQLSNKQRWGRIQSAHNQQAVVELVNPDNDRYRKLNLTNITNHSRPSTMEFRLHGGVEELREAEAWARLLLRFCERASNSNASSNSRNDGNIMERIRDLREDATPAQELVLLWELVACPGLHQFYAMQRKLFEQQRLRINQWRCQQCRRPFDTSRALSQHVEATGHNERR